MTRKNLAYFSISNSPGTSGNLTVSTAVDALHVTLGSGDDAGVFTCRIFETGLGSEVRTGCTYTHGTTTLTRGTLESSTDPAGAALNFTSAAKVQIVGSAGDYTRLDTVALVQAAGPDAAMTMAVGALYVVDGSALTANRTYTLPTTADVGDRIGVMMSAGSASYEVLLTAGSGDTLNGVAGGTEWSRLFITGEVVMLRCIVANSTWIVEHDGRIPCVAAMEDANATTLSHSTFTKITFDTERFDIGGIADPTTNNRFRIRRAGRYSGAGLVNIAAVDSGTRIIARIYKNGSSVSEIARSSAPNVSGGTGVGSGADTLEFAVGDLIELYGFWSITGGTGSKTTDNAVGARTYMSLTEVL